MNPALITIFPAALKNGINKYNRNINFKAEKHVIANTNRK
jgi:hypothetical protein